MTDATTPEQPRTAATTATIAFGALLHRLEEVWIRAGDPEVRAITDGLYAWFEKVEAQARPAVAPLALNPEAEEALDRILGPAVASEGLRAALMRARALLIVGAVAHPNYAEWEKWLQEVDHFLDQTEAQARPAVASEGPANVVAGVKGFVTRPLAERFWEKVQMGEGCWLWRGGTRSPDPDGHAE